MSYYNICPDCGAHLDPCEKCDCQKDKLNFKEDIKNGQANN